MASNNGRARRPTFIAVALCTEHAAAAIDAGDLLAVEGYVELVAFALVVLLSLGAGVAATRVVMGLVLFTMRQLRAQMPSLTES